MVYTHGLGPCVARRGGPNPLSGTINLGVPSCNIVALSTLIEVWIDCLLQFATMGRVQCALELLKQSKHLPKLITLNTLT